MRSGIYKEHSTGDHFADSVAYGTEELGNPGVIHFYKKYKSHISLEMLRMYHHIHHYFSNKEIPDLVLDHTSQYNWIPYNVIHFSILDLNPEHIYMATDRETGSEHWITQPTYVEELDGAILYVDREILRHAATYLLSYLSDNFWLDIVSRFALDNFRISGINNWTLHVVVSDLWSYIQELCIDNLDRINEQIPNRHDTKIQTRKELNATLLGYNIVIDQIR